MAIGTAIAVLVMAVIAFAIWAFTGRQLEITESALTFILYWFGFVLTFNGFAIGAGWIKQHNAPKAAEAEVKRAEAQVQKAVAAKITNGDVVSADVDGRTTVDVDPNRGLDDDGNAI